MPRHAGDQTTLRGEGRARLIGEKLRMFGDAARHDAVFARELPRFLAAVWRVFNEYELAGYVAMQKPAVRRQLRTLLYFS